MAETKICKYCGKLFVPETHRQFYCNVGCRDDMNRKRARENDKKNKVLKRKEKVQKASLRTIAVEARKTGMTYGQYVAMKGV